jgi:hypothetical protein
MGIVHMWEKRGHPYGSTHERGREKTIIEKVRAWSDSSRIIT